MEWQQLWIIRSVAVQCVANIQPHIRSIAIWISWNCGGTFYERMHRREDARNDAQINMQITKRFLFMHAFSFTWFMVNDMNGMKSEQKYLAFDGFCLRSRVTLFLLFVQNRRESKKKTTPPNIEIIIKRRRMESECRENEKKNSTGDDWVQRSKHWIFAHWHWQQQKKKN